MLKYKKIVFMSDILRVSNKEMFYTDRVCRYFYQLFAKQIEAVTNIKLELELAETSHLFDRIKFYNLAGYDCVNENSYIEIAKGNIKKEAINYFKKCFDGCFIIFSEAGALKNVVNKTRINYIDIIISGIRFMDDLKLAFQTNVHEIKNILIKYAIDEDKIYSYANKIKSFYIGRMVYDNSLENNSLLLCGQTEIDLSLIKNQKLVSFADYREEIKILFSKFNKVYYKKHPYAKSDTENEKFILSFDNVDMIDDNTYKLLSCEQITAVAALSSGVLTEAKYFNKDVFYISHQFISYDNKNSRLKDYVIIDDAYYSKSFWKSILSPVFNTIGDGKLIYRNMTNLIRDGLNLYWGYELHNARMISNKKIRPIINDKLDDIEIQEDIALVKKVESLDISVIVQGPITSSTETVLKSVRKKLPQAEIILSTWEGSDILDLDYDVVVLNKDPGTVIMEPVTNKNNNVNRQIISVKNGLNRATRKYALKIRTDTKIVNLGFLKQFNKLNKTPLKREKNFHYFANRIIIDSLFTRDPRNNNTKQLGLCFHPSDLWHFGLTSDLKQLFDIPLQTKFINEIDGRLYQYRVPEQYIWTSFLEKKAVKIPMDSMYYNERYTRNLTLRTIVNNFFILDNSLCGIKYPNSFHKHNSNIFKYVISTEKYFEIYRNLYDYNYQYPKFYDLSIEINKIRKHFSVFYKPLKLLFRWLETPFSIVFYISKLGFKIIKNTLTRYKIRS